ncbi:GAP family protein [Corynebacterium timonense]|uniref:Sap, sulfolipid-1-addressing protein n=1 Tax=Corynebacterium timonense TaxID=441500 RepID=A0A1H1V746_9CORY|nr:GAP family protein [Corynebacterium timonense]SDS80503.1 Sap, sulfolipid-1-addressing protein [Corynebacterium timonense]
MSSVIPVIGLALLDSLSLGTLVIPLALIVHWRAVRVPALTAYLFTVALVYFLLGLGMLLGFAGLGSVAERVTQTDIFPWITLTLGAALAVFGIFGPDPTKPEPGQLPKRATGATSSLPRMVALGLGASLTEAATMLPYIAAMGIIGSWDIPSVAKAGAVGIYCLIMIVPTVLLATLALLFGQKFFPRLERLIPRLEYEAKVTLLWIAAIVGIYMVARSVATIRGDLPAL